MGNKSSKLSRPSVKSRTYRNVSTLQDQNKSYVSNQQEVTIRQPETKSSVSTPQNKKMFYYDMGSIDLDTLNITRLKAIAREVGVKGFSKYTQNDRQKLIDLILGSVKAPESNKPKLLNTNTKVVEYSTSLKNTSDKNSFIKQELSSIKHIVYMIADKNFNSVDHKSAMHTVINKLKQIKDVTGVNIEPTAESVKRAIITYCQ